DDPHKALKDKEIFDCGCSSHMTGNRDHLADYQNFKGGSVAFGGRQNFVSSGSSRPFTSGSGGAPGKQRVIVCYNYKGEGHMSKQCIKPKRKRDAEWFKDKKNKVLFTDTDCLMLSPDFKLPDEHQVLPKIPIQHNMYSFNLKNIDPSGDLSCLFAKASIDESNKWHRRLGHVNFNNLNKLVKRNLVRGLPSKIFENDHTYVACPKGKQHKASCKFDGKSNSGFLVGYSLNSKAFRVYNLETKRVEENLHVNFLENKPNVAGKGHAWMFDLDYLTNSMNYEPISLENQANKSAGPPEAKNSAYTQANNDQGANSEEIDLHDKHFVLPIWSAYSTTVKSSGHKIQKTTDYKTCKKPVRHKIQKTTDYKTCEKPVSQVEQIFQEELEKLKRQEKEANDALRKEATPDSPNANTNNANLLNVVSAPVGAVGPPRALNDAEPSYPDDPLMPHLKDIFASPSEGIFTNSSYDDEGVVTEFNNLETTVNVSPTPTTRIHTIHLKT
nr:ribonuclease H-like domain-containing protein [Tanacetum cinerariifolium]